VKPITLHTAALAGFFYAVLMCGWVYFDKGTGLNGLSIRFAAYFAVFTLGFYFLYNFVAKRKGPPE
jgi:hypothetical protein